MQKLLVTAAALAALTGVALAGGGHGKSKEARAARRAEMLKLYDANGDGKLDDAERQKKHEAIAEKRFAELDADGDGILSKAEFTAGMKDRGHRGHRGPRGKKTKL